MARIDFHRTEGTIDRNKPAELMPHMSDIAWTKFCDDVDVIAKAGMKFNHSMKIRLFTLIGVCSLVTLGLVYFLFFGNGRDRFSPTTVPIIAIPMIVSIAILIFIMRRGNMEADKFRKQLEDVLAEASRTQSNVSFHLKEDVIHTGGENGGTCYRWYIEASTTTGSGAAVLSGGGGTDTASRLEELEKIKHMLSEQEYSDKRADILSNV